MDEARDNPRVIAPPPLIALATVLLGVVLDWFFPFFTPCGELSPSGPG
jgi:hypothetical protein